MTLSKKLLAATAFAAAAALPAIASAAPGRATGDVSLRSGPGTSYGRIAVIPAGAPVEVFDCDAWCRVSWRGADGFVSASYITAGGGYDRPRAYREPQRYERYAPVPRGYSSYRDYRLGYFGAMGQPFRSPYDDPFLFDD